jgi:hypothetical protein
MTKRLNIGAMAAACCPMLLGSCTTPPQRPDIKESQSQTVPRSAISGTAIRWENENVYYFSKHSTGAGILSNPYAFYVELSSVPPRLSVKVDGQDWPKIDFGAAPPQNSGAYAYRFGEIPGTDPDNSANTRSLVFLSPPQGPGVIDNGRTWQAVFTDSGGTQYQGAPTTFAFSFAFVEPGRCQIPTFTMNPSNPGVGSAYTVTFATSGTCKAARVKANGTTLLEDLKPGLGGTFAATFQRTGEANGVNFTAEAWDAAGQPVLAPSLSIFRSNLPTGGVSTSTPGSSPTPTAACPGNPDGLPKSLTLCASCPVRGAEPRKTTTYASACSLDALRQDPGFAGCTLTEGECAAPSPSPTPTP